MLAAATRFLGVLDHVSYKSIELFVLLLENFVHSLSNALPETGANGCGMYEVDT